MNTNTVDIENPLIGGRSSQLRVNPPSEDTSMTEIQIQHRDEVLKRLANFKEKTNDVLIEQIPE